MYLNLIQIAESFGVSEKVVEGWMHDDCLPHTIDRGRSWFDRAQVTQWATSRGLASRVGFLAPDNAAFATGCVLEPLLRAGGIWRDVPASDVLRVIENVLARLPATPPAVRQLLGQRLRARGGVTWAPVGGGFAIPHLSSRVALGRESGAVALLLLREGLAEAEPTPDGVPVTRLFYFIAPSPRAHLDLLGRLGRGLTRGPLRDLIVGGAADEDILRAVATGDATDSHASSAKGTP